MEAVRFWADHDDNYNKISRQIGGSEVALELQQIEVVLPLPLQAGAQDDHQAHQIEEAERHQDGKVSVLVCVSGSGHDVLQQARQGVAGPDVSRQLLPHELPEDEDGEVEESDHAAAQGSAREHEVY